MTRCIHISARGIFVEQIAPSAVPFELREIVLTQGENGRHYGHQPTTGAERELLRKTRMRENANAQMHLLPTIDGRTTASSAQLRLPDGGLEGSIGEATEFLSALYQHDGRPRIVITPDSFGANGHEDHIVGYELGAAMSDAFGHRHLMFGLPHLSDSVVELPQFTADARGYVEQFPSQFGAGLANIDAEHAELLAANAPTLQTY